jgi:hypothetical protein
MESNTSPALFQLSQEDLHPVPPLGRSKGLNIHAVTLIRLTQADQRAQRAMQISYRRYPALPCGSRTQVGPCGLVGFIALASPSPLASLARTSRRLGGDLACPSARVWFFPDGDLG